MDEVPWKSNKIVVFINLFKTYDPVIKFLYVSNAVMYDGNLLRILDVYELNLVGCVVSQYILKTNWLKQSILLFVGTFCL